MLHPSPGSTLALSTSGARAHHNGAREQPESLLALLRIHKVLAPEICNFYTSMEITGLRKGGLDNLPFQQ